MRGAHLTVAAIVFDDERFLLVEERDKAGKAVINQPAGHWERGETLAQACVRETLEETRYPFQPESLVGIYQWTVPNSDRTYFRVCYAGSVQAERTDLTLDPDIQKAFWATRNDLVSAAYTLRSPLVLKCIDDYLAGKRYPLEMISDIE